MTNVNAFLPYLRVATAVSPFVAALALRLLLGRNRITQFLVSAATTWFAVNVLLAPFTNPGQLGSWLLR